VALISGAYFPLSALPDPLPDIAKVVPFTWGLDTLRGALLGSHVAIWKCLALVGIAALLFPLALALYQRALEAARRRGSLGLY
jgi:ABC-type multidrug transport system permease subunit